VPTLFVSDWHWGEVVDPEQINGVNGYNLNIARQRAKYLAIHTIDLLTKHMVNPHYPGLVVAVGGDMFSGDIHEELSVTNENDIMPLFVDLHGIMVWFFDTLIKQFGKVYVPWVTGNHSRTTRKPRTKNRNYTNFDWLLGTLLERHYDGDSRIQFNVGAGPDVPYQVYSHKYLLTHGDQFRGGDGIIGPLGPITRGDNRKRARNSAINLNYDTLLMGHWHQHIPLNRLIVNGSLKGYDEYAHSENLPFEVPKQALWITHPQYGITIQTPVFVNPKVKLEERAWVSWEK
jgi:hypothetical protein